MKPLLRTLLIPLYLLTLLLNSTDVSANNLSTAGTVLDSSWERCYVFDDNTEQVCEFIYLPQKQVKPPKNYRHIIYSTRFNLAREYQLQNLGLAIEQIDDIDEVYLNGHLIGKTGRFPPVYEHASGYPRLYSLPASYLYFNQPNQLVIKTFSSRQKEGLFRQVPVIDNYETLASQQKSADLTYTVIVSILMVAAIFQLFYFILIPASNETLFFFMFVIGCALTTVASSQLPLHIGFNLNGVLRLKSLISIISLLVLFVFVQRFFDYRIRRWQRGILLVVGFLGLSILAWPYTLSLRLAAELMQLTALTAITVAMSALFKTAFDKKRPYWAYVFFATLAFLVGNLTVAIAPFLASGTLPPVLIVSMPILLKALFALVISLTITHKYWQYFKGATYDHLTGTLLRPAFFQRLGEEMQRAQRGDMHLLVAMVSIEQFKAINENYGHQAAEQLLHFIARGLMQALRQFDLICRFGEEEFCIAASVRSEDDAQACLQRMHDQIKESTIQIENNIAIASESTIGSVLFDVDKHFTASQLVQDADLALAQTKSNHRGNFHLVIHADSSLNFPI